MKRINMKRIITFLGLTLAVLLSYSQSPIYGRLRVISGTSTNSFINSTDSFNLGWDASGFKFDYSGKKRWMYFNKSDSTVSVYNKLILESPNDTMLSVRGRSYFGGFLDFPYSLRFRSTNSSLYIGHGVINVPTTSAAYNVGIGYYTMGAITTGDYNIGLGYNAIGANTTGSDNIAIGNGALEVLNGVSSNIAIGTWSLRQATTGISIAIGHRCLQAGGGGGNVGMGYTTMLNLGATAVDNTAIGALAMQIGTAGNYNTGIGAWSLYYTGQSGAASNNNSAIGWKAGFNNRSGSDNTYLGFQAGYSVQSGSGNIFIGSNAGYSETGSNKLYIDNSNTSTPLIYGDFTDNKVRINGTDTALTISGKAHALGNIYANEYKFNSWTGSYLTGEELYLENGSNTAYIANYGSPTISVTYDAPITYWTINRELYVTTSSRSIVYDTLGIRLDQTDYRVIKGGALKNRFYKLGIADSSMTVYNKLILESPNDTMLLSVRGGGMKVIDGSVLFNGTTGATPASGAGTRMMWIPEKGAFRAGIVDGTQWDDGYIGDYSSSFGNATTASGDYSFAFGSSSIASGDYSVAMGIGTTASGAYSSSMGAATTASGDYSVSMGNSTTASGDYSFAMGELTIASGLVSHAEGNNTIARGNASHSGGTYNIANSYNLTSIGSYNDTTISTSLNTWVLTDPLFQVGNGLTDATRNDAFRILKNGKTYIGDMSSTTDPIMIVDPTDSTTTVIGTLTTDHININGLTIFSKNTTIADDSVIVMADGLFGFGEVYIFNAGAIDQFARFYFSNDGAVVLLEYSANAVNTDTDGNLCIFDNGAGITIKNRMGGSRTIKLKINY